MTTQLAGSLTKEGNEVVVLVPKKYAPKKKNLYGFEVRGLSWNQILSRRTYQKLDADVYHSQNPTIMSLVASLAEPTKKQIITCRDPRDTKDWIVEFIHATWNRRLKIPFNYLFEEGILAKIAVRKADVVGCPAQFLRKKVKRMYGLKELPILLPNIEVIPDSTPKKSKTPTVCFVGRLDKRKRPEKIFDISKKFPHVSFLVVGISEEKNRQAWLEREAKKIPNLHMLGLINKFTSKKLYKIYDKSWILLNTSAREGLPLSFIEAASRGCAILSSVNPDSFASKFGYWAKKGDFEKGLGNLLSHQNWKAKGKMAHKYVYQTYRKHRALKVHIKNYTAEK